MQGAGPTTVCAVHAGHTQEQSAPSCLLSQEGCRSCRLSVLQAALPALKCPKNLTSLDR